MSARLHKPFTKPPYFSDIFKEPGIRGDMNGPRGPVFENPFIEVQEFILRMYSRTISAAASTPIGPVLTARL